MAKISIITVVYNRERTIQRCIRSLYGQTFQDFEHIVVDGASKDDTLRLIEECETTARRIIVSEPDKGIYDALNKALALCSGEYIGVLHSDDVFADRFVLENVARALNNKNCDLLYGDLLFFREAEENVVREWKSGGYVDSKLQFGWMPPHPTVFVKRAAAVDELHFDTSFNIAADYDFLLRFLTRKKRRAFYLPINVTKMEVGGVSTNGLNALRRSFKEDLEVARRYLKIPVFAAVFKRLRKIGQLRPFSRPN